jgi:NAD(P)-dependent dehydrogenase (short-subunit alcohol dehydrogenase family)
VRLRGQVALVTGGSRGIGRAAALALGAEGAAVAVVARTTAALEGVAEELRRRGGRALAVPGDAGVNGTAERAVEAALARFGRLDVLVTAQGTGSFAPVAESDPADWDRMMADNLRATYLACRAALRPMLGAGRGTIITIVSLAAVRPIPGSAAYTASKAGVLGFSRVLREEVRGRGVRVAALCPGAVDTPFWDAIPGAPDRARMLRAETVAEAVLLVAGAPPEATVEEIILAPAPGVL